MLLVITQRALLTLAIGSAMAATLAGCSSSSGSDAVSSAAAPVASATAAASPAASAPSAPSASSAASGSAAPRDAATQAWCDDYSSVAGTLASSTTSAADAKLAVGAINAFEQLWVDGADRGYVTPEEMAANQRAIAAFKAVITLYANGAAADSPELTAAQAELSTVTGKDRELLLSTDKKVLALCTVPSASAIPSASASASPASS